MREGLRHDAALRLLLQPVVADRSSRAQTVFGVAGLADDKSNMLVLPEGRTR